MPVSSIWFENENTSSVQVLWDKPQHSLTGYEITYNGNITDTANQKKKLNSGDTTKTWVSNLTAGEQYTFTIVTKSGDATSSEVYNTTSLSKYAACSVYSNYLYELTRWALLSI